MSEREHERAINLALRTERELRLLFDRLGNQAHPRGRVLSAYRQARRAIKGNGADLLIVREVLGELRWAINDVAQDSLATASRAGVMQAQSTLSVYGLGGVSGSQSTATELDAWMSSVDAQASSVLALAMSGDEAAILGDGERVGVLSPSPIVREGARWLTVAALAGVTSGISSAVSRQGAQDDFKRQAVAGIDNRTTDCCLRVHGQVVAFDKPFVLRGTPRFASEMMSAPFHHHCRTSVALVRAEDADDALTRKMQDAASYELSERATTGKPGAFGYTDATSRRTGVLARPVKRPTTAKPINAQATQAAQAAKVNALAAKLQGNWVNGANSKGAIQLKEGIRAEFGVKGLVMNRRGFDIAPADVRAARQASRAMYEATQSSLKGQGSIKLFRGVKSEIRTPGVVESWSTDRGTARKFDGHDIIEMEIPVDRIFSYSGGPGWKNGRFGEQYEYMVLSEAPRR